jgi:hypothetical protein
VAVMTWREQSVEASGPYDLGGPWLTGLIEVIDGGVVVRRIGVTHFEDLPREVDYAAAKAYVASINTYRAAGLPA